MPEVELGGDEECDLHSIGLEQGSGVNYPWDGWHDSPWRLPRHLKPYRYKSKEWPPPTSAALPVVPSENNNLHSQLCQKWRLLPALPSPARHWVLENALLSILGCPLSLFSLTLSSDPLSGGRAIVR